MQKHIEIELRFENTENLRKSSRFAARKLPTFATSSSSTSLDRRGNSSEKQFAVKWQLEKRQTTKKWKQLGAIVMKKVSWKLRIIIGVKLIIKRTNLLVLFFFLFWFHFDGNFVKKHEKIAQQLKRLLFSLSFQKIARYSRRCDERRRPEILVEQLPAKKTRESKVNVTSCRTFQAIGNSAASVRSHRNV